MSREPVVEAAAVGGPGGGVASDGAGSVPGVWADASAAASTTGICICDPELYLLDVHDLRCPTHGLTATLEEAVRAQKERDRG